MQPRLIGLQSGGTLRQGLRSRERDNRVARHAEIDRFARRDRKRLIPTIVRRVLASYGIGFRESEDGKVYIEVSVQGIDVTSLREEIPNEIAGYKVRLLQPSPSP